MPRHRPAITPDGRLDFERIGVKLSRRRDVYHRLLSVSWPRLLVLLTAAVCAVNSLFALAYLALGDAIEHARPGSFADAFFFSVQTLATIGYGAMSPRTVAGNLVVLSEVLVGLVGLAVVTGITFAKFARPTARVLFSNVALITVRDGVPCFMFRAANQRGSSLVEAHAHVVLARDETTLEGEEVRRVYDLPLLRAQNMIFSLSWTIVHPITPSSPLYGATAASLEACDAAVAVSIAGVEEVFGQSVHARHAYSAADIRWGGRYADIISRLPDGRRRLNLARIHDVIASEPAAVR